MSLNFWSLPPPLRFWDDLVCANMLGLYSTGTEPRASYILQTLHLLSCVFIWLFLPMSPNERSTSQKAATQQAYLTHLSSRGWIDCTHMKSARSLWINIFNRVKPDLLDTGFIHIWGKLQSLGIRYITQMKTLSRVTLGLNNEVPRGRFLTGN